MPSAVEAECEALLYNDKEIEALRKTLRDISHPQQATEIVTYN